MAVIVLTGGNNLRWRLETSDQFIMKCKMIVDNFILLKNAYLVLISLLPSPVSYNYSHNLFEECNSRLMNLSLLYPCVSYMNITDPFMKNQNIDITKFHDKIHLN